MGGGSSKQRSRRRVTFKDEEDEDEESYDRQHPDDGHSREESTTSLGQKIRQRARNDRGPPPSPSPQRQQRGPVVILIRDPKTGQIRRASSFSDVNEKNSKKANPEEANPPAPPPPETQDKRRKHRPSKPAMSFDLWGDPVLGPDVESIAPPASTTSSQNGGSFRARKEYDRQLAIKRQKQNQRKELQLSVSESDVRDASTPRATPVELYPEIRQRRLTEDSEDESETTDASNIGVKNNQSILRRPGAQQQVPPRDRNPRKKPPYEILSERKRKKMIPKSDQATVSYQQLSHGFSSTSEQFSQNVSKKFIPSKDDSKIEDVDT